MPDVHLIMAETQLAQKRAELEQTEIMRDRFEELALEESQRMHELQREIDALNKRLEAWGR